jgi:hypothetical protein
LSFGIRVNDFPVTFSGDIKLINHNKWMERQRKNEAFLQTNTSIEGAADLPSKADILFGRDSQFVDHPGNNYLHEMVATYFDQYNRELRAGKTRLAAEIVSLIHECSGRFVKQDDHSGMWVEVTNLEAQNKVSHSFRSKREADLNAAKKFATKDAQVLKKGKGDGRGKRLDLISDDIFSIEEAISGGKLKLFEDSS